MLNLIAVIRAYIGITQTSNYFRLTKQGMQAIAGPDYKSHMPAFEGKLTDEQIWSVLAYVKSQRHQGLAERHSKLYEK